MSAPVLEKPQAKTARWKATIFYRTDIFGLLDVEHAIEELDELHEIVERGPDWNAIDHITIQLDRKSDPELTIEKAAKQ